MTNLMLPGNPRYQPSDLVDVWGYDNLFRALADVEIATMLTLAEYGKIPEEDIRLLSPMVRRQLREITTSEVDKVEREVTKHDVRAWVRIAQDIIPHPLRPWVHVPLTSYDGLDTARSLQFTRAHNASVWPKLAQVGEILGRRVECEANTPQIGRTHGQHALPITVGFWLATTLSRYIDNVRRLNAADEQLVGKISGAVGAYNAQFALGLHPRDGKTFEVHVLEKLGLKPAPVSTQIAPPEPLAQYLFSSLLVSATLGQFGRDCRHLMRDEIGEVFEGFEQGQVGSSTMAHKRNPINFEQLEGMFLRSKAEFGKVLDTLISDHQRDLVGSCVARDFPIIVINLVQQLNTLLRKKGDMTFLERVRFDSVRCHQNLERSVHLTIAEPLYIFLQANEYPGDAHALVNEKLVPRAKSMGISLLLCAQELNDPDVNKVLERLNDDEVQVLLDPMQYTGLAAKIASETAERAQKFFAP